MQRVFVTGIGIVSSIGANVSQSYKSLCSLKSGIRTIQSLDTKLKDKFPAGEVPITNEELKQLLAVKDRKPYSRTSLLAILAAKEAFEGAGINDKRKLTTGLVSSTSVGGMDVGEKFYRNYINNKNNNSLKDALVYDCSDSTECVANYLGITDYISTISTACSSSANAILYGANLIKAGILDRVVAGGADALTLYTINGFNSLMILSEGHCRPYDQQRNGLNLGEGAAYLILESEESLISSGKEPLAELRGYGNACDAYHQTASSAEGIGAGLAMNKALVFGNSTTEEISYINVHGTGTINNDLSEGRAIERLFGSKIPPFSSTKPYTGHTLAAAGAIEAVFSILSIQNNIIFPNLNFTEQMKELKISPVKELKPDTEVKQVLSNSFGFGGNNTSLLFSKC